MKVVEPQGVREVDVEVVVALLLMLLYGCELSHYSWSSLRQLRGRCSAVLWGQGNNRDHFLSPLVSAADVFEPSC